MILNLGHDFFGVYLVGKIILGRIRVYSKGAGSLYIC
jgi:hypothetical protein